MRRLLVADLVARRRMLAALSLGAGLFVAFLTTLEALGGLSQVGRRAFVETPPALAALAGSRSGLDVFTPLGLLAFAYNHPFFLALGLAPGLALGSAAVAGDVESGRAQLWYVRPVSRHRVLAGRVAAWVAVQTLVVAAAVVGGVAGSALSEDLGGAGMAVAARAGAQFLALSLAVGALAFAVSAFTSTRGGAVGTAVGLTLFAYLVNFVSLLWGSAAPLRWATPFGFYDPLAAVSGFRLVDAAILTTVAAVLLGLAHVGLSRRDLA